MPFTRPLWVLPSRRSLWVLPLAAAAVVAVPGSAMGDGALDLGVAVKGATKVGVDTPGTFPVTFSAAPFPVTPQLNLVSHSALRTITVVIPPVPAPPTSVSATQSGDSPKVSWMPDPATQNYLTSSTFTATPSTGSMAPVLTRVVVGLAKAWTVLGVTARPPTRSPSPATTTRARASRVRPSRC